MKTTLILKHSDNPLFAWPQFRFDAHKVRALGSPLRHAPFEFCHQREELVVPVCDDVRPFMAIHVDSLLDPRAPPSKGKKPSARRSLRQSVSNGEPERWEDVVIEGMMELLRGHFAQRHT